VRSRANVPITKFAIHSDSDYVVYIAEEIPGVEQLFAVPIDGAKPRIQLHDATLAPDPSVDFKIVPGTRRVLYETLGELFSAKLPRLPRRSGPPQLPLLEVPVD
jgi:hypothetical protein